MKKIYGVIGSTGKLGSLLVQRPDFVKLDVDIRSVSSLHGLRMYLDGNYNGLDVIVNCAAISSIDECEGNYEKAIKVNVHGLSNLHKVFGDRVLNISTDHVFNGRNWLLPREGTTPAPINSYGLTKFASEGVSQVFGGKTIRLSRTVSHLDPDLNQYLHFLEAQEQVTVPDFFSRNYIHREYAVMGIEYMVRHWDDMPSVVNYAGTENVTMYSFVKMLAMEANFRPQDVLKRNKYDDSLVPRPRKGGLNVSLAKSLGFPMFNVSDTVSKVVEDYFSD